MHHIPGWTTPFRPITLTLRWYIFSPLHGTISLRSLQTDKNLLLRKEGALLARLGKKGKTLLQREIKNGRAKLESELNTSRLEDALNHHVTEISRHLRNSALCLQNNRPDKALRSIRQAIASEQSIDQLLRLIRRFEDHLLRLANRDVRIEKKLISS